MENTKVKKTNKKSKIILVTIVFILITAIIVSLVVLVYNHINNNNKDKVIINGTLSLKNVTGKLANYIEGLGNNYYIRYNGEFGKKGLNENLVSATIEYTQNGPNTAIYSENINMHILKSGDYAYNIVHKQSMILKVKLPVQFNSEPYNLISDFGQIYVADVSTKVAGVDYIYQEYHFDDAKIRYYFVGDDLRYIRVIVGDIDRKINIRVDRNTKYELLELPKEYMVYDV